MSVLKTTGLYILNGQIVWCVNYFSINYYKNLSKHFKKNQHWFPWRTALKGFGFLGKLFPGESCYALSPSLQVGAAGGPVALAERGQAPCQPPAPRRGLSTHPRRGRQSHETLLGISRPWKSRWQPLTSAWGEVWWDPGPQPRCWPYLAQVGHLPQPWPTLCLVPFKATCGTHTHTHTHRAS